MTADWSLHLMDSSAETPAINEPVMLLWTDPPYGTGKQQEQGGIRYADRADTEYVLRAVEKWLPLMDDNGTVVVCCDYRLAHRVVSMMVDANGWFYRGEIIWEFGLGKPRTSWWPNRHNNMLTFTKHEHSGKFNLSAVPRTKRLAPKKGYEDTKPAGSVWEYTMSNTSPERVGYPNQKPLSLISPFVLAHTDIGDLVVDPFCGSSSVGAAAIRHNRRYVGCDISTAAIDCSRERLSKEVVDTQGTDTLK